jgi:hypothetical protein
MTRRAVILSCLACLVAGYIAASVPGFDPVNPFVPKRPDRPVARFLAKLAKIGLWVTVFASPAPQSLEQSYSARLGDDGVLCHAEGW